VQVKRSANIQSPGLPIISLKGDPRRIFEARHPNLVSVLYVLYSASVNGDAKGGNNMGFGLTGSAP
jgi:hypothetical protein